VEGSEIRMLRVTYFMDGPLQRCLVTKCDIYASTVSVAAESRTRQSMVGVLAAPNDSVAAVAAHERQDSAHCLYSSRLKCTRGWS